MFSLVFQSSSLSLHAHSVNPLCWLQSLIPSIHHRQVVFFIEIKLIIFHVCTHAATVSYTFTRYYLCKVSWLWNTLSKLKVGNVPKPDIISCAAFFGESKAAQSHQSVGLSQFEISCQLRAQFKLQFKQITLHGWAEVSSSRRLKLSDLWWNAAINFKWHSSPGRGEKRDWYVQSHRDRHSLLNRV